MDKSGKTNGNGHLFHGFDGFPPNLDGNKANSMQTKIKIDSGKAPSKIGVTIFPALTKPKGCWHGTATVVGMVIILLLLTLFLLSFFLYAELKQTKRELEELQSLVARLEKETFSSESQSTEYVDYRERAFEENRFKREARRNENMTNDYPLVANFIGRHPQVVTDNRGVIAPWFKDNLKEFDLDGVLLKDGLGSIVIPESGLYFIYAQVYYSSVSGNTNSYSILLKDEDNRETKIATCSQPPGTAGESSCWTGIAYFIKQGTKVQLKQREIKRYVLFQKGQTFLGLVLLRPSSTKS